MAEGEIEDHHKNHSHSAASDSDQTATTISSSASKQQQHIVLIHGICGGAWCWYKIKPLLEISGYKVTCLDLKSAGIDPTDADTVLTFDDYNQPLDTFMESSLPEGEKVVLVGHSAGGLTVTWATQKYPDKVQGCIYVAATMLERGYETLEDIKIGVPDVSEMGDIFDYGYAHGDGDSDGSPTPTSAIFKDDYLRKLVFPLSPLEDFTLAAMLSRPGPLLALLTAKFDEPEITLPRVYIKTKQDELMKIWQQEAMIEKWKPTEVYDIDSDHSPFLSTPLILFSLILKSANLIASLSSNLKTTNSKQ